jgi:hypothetical protein
LTLRRIAATDAERFRASTQNIVVLVRGDFLTADIQVAFDALEPRRQIAW